MWEVQKHRSQQIFLPSEWTVCWGGGAAINKSHRTADQKRSDGFSLNYGFTDLTAHTHTQKDCNDCTHQHTNRLNTLTHEVLINGVISAGATWLDGTFCAFFHRFKHFVTFLLLILRCAARWLLHVRSIYRGGQKSVLRTASRLRWRRSGYMSEKQDGHIYSCCLRCYPTPAVLVIYRWRQRRRLWDVYFSSNIYRSEKQPLTWSSAKQEALFDLTVTEQRGGIKPPPAGSV